MAELNLAILLAEARKIIKYSNRIQEGKWEREVGLELSGKTMGILGLGAIGRKFVELLEGFHMKILAYDVRPDLSWCAQRQVTMVKDLDEIFRQSDFISLNLPLLESTKHIINANSLRKMKKDVIIVNTARGGLINTRDLIHALKEKTIRGAALDAFESEPLEPASELRNLDVTLTPHLPINRCFFHRDNEKCKPDCGQSSGGSSAGWRCQQYAECRIGVTTSDQSTWRKDAQG